MHINRIEAGDVILAGPGYGRVRQMLDDQGRLRKLAGMRAERASQIARTGTAAMAFGSTSKAVGFRYVLPTLNRFFVLL